MWLLLATIVCLPLGMIILLSVSRAELAEVERRHGRTAIGLRVLGALVLVICSALIVVSVINLVGWGGWSTTAEAALASAVAAVALAPIGVMLIVLSLDLTGDRLHSQWFGPRQLRRLLSLAGYGLCLLPAFLLFPPLGAMVAAVVFVVLAHVRRARDRNLLWLLTIAVERRFPLEDELEAGAETVDRRLEAPLRMMAEELRAGVSLPDVLASAPRVVPAPVALAARVGEQTGTLAESLKVATESVAGPAIQASRASYLTSIVTYVWMVVVVLAGIVGFCMYYIVPKYKAIFDDFGVEMPPVTRWLIRSADFMVDWAFLTAPAVIALLAASIFAAECYRRGWKTLSLPWLTKWWPRLDTPDILRNLSSAVASRTPLPAVLRTLADYHHRPHIRQRLGRAWAVVEGGGDTWQALENVGLLQEPEVRLLQAAGRAGNLPWALHDLANRQERRRSDRLLACYEVLRPWPVLVLGLAAALFVIGMFLPLVTLIEELS